VPPKGGIYRYNKDIRNELYLADISLKNVAKLLNLSYETFMYQLNHRELTDHEQKMIRELIKEVKADRKEATQLHFNSPAEEAEFWHSRKGRKLINTALKDEIKQP
jgi:hypothetical protein